MSASTTPLWGQAWKLTVQSTMATGPQSVVVGSSEWEPESLRVTFEAEQTTLHSWWFADISVYNYNTVNAQNVLLNATWATLEAGFQSGPTSKQIIWDGPVLQALLDREAVTDLRITLHCVANPLVMDDIINFSSGPMSSQAQLVARMASEIDLPPISTGAGTMSQLAATKLNATQYLRGNTVFGKTSKYLNQIADSNFMQSWQDGKQAYISEIGSGATTPNLIYSPPIPPGQTAQSFGLTGNVTTSIIGTPRQTPFGVIFDVLLDPRLKVQLPPLVVQLQRALITQLSVSPGDTVASPMSADLLFFVSQVRHIGDTRGNDWHTEVVGYGTAYAQGMLDGIFAANSGGT